MPTAEQPSHSAVARSEWVQGAGGRVAPTQRLFVAPLEPVEAATAMAPLPKPAQPLAVEPCRQPMTQILIQVRKDQRAQVFLDGHLAAPEEDGTYTLPVFRMDEQISDNETRRASPAPLMLACLVEDGARKPNLIKAEVIQRNFVNNNEVGNYNEELVAVEENLKPFVTSDPLASAFAIAYPARFTKGPYVAIEDKTTERAKSMEKTKKAAEGALRTVIRTSTTSIDLLNKTGQAAENLISKFNQFSRNASRLLEELGEGRPARIATSLLQMLNVGLQISRLIELQALIFEGKLDLASYDDLRRLGRIAESAGNAIFQYYLWSRATSTDGKTDTYEIPLARFTHLLERAVGYSTGGQFSNNGTIWTLQELEESGRKAEAALLAYFHLSSTNPAAYNNIDASVFSKLWEGNPQIEQRVLDDLQAMQLQKDDGPKSNIVHLDGLDYRLLEMRGYVQFDVRVSLIFDSRNDLNRNIETYTFCSSTEAARAAGWLASGALADVAKFYTTAQNLSDYLGNDFAQLIERSPIINYSYSGRVVTDIIGYFIGENSNLQASASKFKSEVERLLREMTQKLEDTRSAILATNFDAANTNDQFIRRLAQRVKVSKVLVGNAHSVPENSEVSYARTDEPLARISDGFMDAIYSANRAGFTARRAIRQFVERDGTLRSRTRMLIRYNLPASLAPPTNAEAKGWVDLNDELFADDVRVMTRNVYMPRLPLLVVDAMDGYSQHTRLGERTRIEWLSRPVISKPAVPGVETWAKALNVEPTHAGELTASVLVDEQCTDVINRELCMRRVMAPPDDVARANMKRAAALADIAVDMKHTPAFRIPHNDAFYDCFPGGPSLRRALAESPAWRAWRDSDWIEHHPPGAHVAQLADAYDDSALASPSHLWSVVHSLRSSGADPRSYALEKYGRRVHCTRMPFLSGQTLTFASPKPHGGVFGPLDQLEHALKALRRVDALARALALDESQRTSMLLDAVHARPILQLAENSTTPLEVLDRPVMNADDDFDVPDLGNLPETVSLPWLQNRLNTMRLDVEIIASSTNDGAAPFDCETPPCQYMVPFGAGSPTSLQPPLSNAYAMEQAPLRIEAVHAQLRDMEALRAMRAEIPEIRCIELASEAASPSHPMIITASEDHVVIRVAFNTIQAPNIAGLQEPAENTLHDWIVHGNEPASIASRCAYIDVTADIMWTIERLVQALHIVYVRSNREGDDDGGDDGGDDVDVYIPVPDVFRSRRREAPSDPEPMERVTELETRMLMIVMATYYEGPGGQYKTADLGSSATSAAAAAAGPAPAAAGPAGAAAGPVAAAAGPSTSSAPLLDSEALVSNVELPPDDALAKDFIEQLQIEEDVGGRYILLPTKNPPKITDELGDQSRQDLEDIVNQKIIPRIATEEGRNRAFIDVDYARTYMRAKVDQFLHGNPSPPRQARANIDKLNKFLATTQIQLGIAKKINDRLQKPKMDEIQRVQQWNRARWDETDHRATRVESLWPLVVATAVAVVRETGVRVRAITNVDTRPQDVRKIKVAHERVVTVPLCEWVAAVSRLVVE